MEFYSMLKNTKIVKIAEKGMNKKRTQDQKDKWCIMSFVS